MDTKSTSCNFNLNCLKESCINSSSKIKFFGSFNELRDLKSVYLAGAHREKTALQVDRNVLLASDTSMLLRKMYGVKVFTPHLNLYYIEDQGIIKEFIEDECKYWLSLCEGLVVLPNWMYSEGTKMEMEYALSIGMDVYMLTHSDIGYLKTIVEN